MKENPIPPLLKDDPDIRQKMKELELAKLDRQIQEVRGGPSSDMVMRRLVINQIELLFYMYKSGAISDETYASLVSNCPWCGASNDDGLSYEDTGKGGYLCAR